MERDSFHDVVYFMLGNVQVQKVCDGRFVYDASCDGSKNHGGRVFYSNCLR